MTITIEVSDQIGQVLQELSKEELEQILRHTFLVWNLGRMAGLKMTGPVIKRALSKPAQAEQVFGPGVPDGITAQVPGIDVVPDVEEL